MAEYLIVDGYNMINSWPVLKTLKDESLEHARAKLIELMANYRGYKGMNVYVVFDGYQVKGNEGTEDQIAGINIIYTAEGQTADSAIERLVTQLAKEGQMIAVATSDWAQQQIVLGKGARRYSARELWQEVGEVEAILRKDFSQLSSSHKRNHLESRLRKDVWERMEKWRKGQQ